MKKIIIKNNSETRTLPDPTKREVIPKKIKYKSVLFSANNFDKKNKLKTPKMAKGMFIAAMTPINRDR